MKAHRARRVKEKWRVREGESEREMFVRSDFTSKGIIIRKFFVVFVILHEPASLNDQTV